MHDAKKSVGSLCRMLMNPDSLQIWAWSTENLEPQGQDAGRLSRGQQYRSRICVKITFHIKAEIVLSHRDGGQGTGPALLACQGHCSLL